MSVPIRAVRGREFQLLTEAHRARKTGKNRSAIRLYKRILIENPHNYEVALRCAPMLAMAGEHFEAWQLYRRVAREYAREKLFTECLSVYREACRFVPFEFDAWRLCAELQLKMNHPDGAYETLIDGRMHFGGPNTRSEAIALLTRARTIEPWDDDLLLDLADLYRLNDQPEIARELLSTLACRVQGPRLRKVRFMQWRISYSVKDLWHWFCTFFMRAKTESEEVITTMSHLEPLEPVVEPVEIFEDTDTTEPIQLHQIVG